MSNFDSYSTHKKFLEHYVKESSGDILEFGCGYGSTPMLRKLIEGTDRKLYSFESDLVWLKQMEQEVPAHENHQYIFVPEWNNFIPGLSKKYTNNGVIFIDQSPWEARYKTLQEFTDKSEYILIHDVDWFPENGMFGRKRGEFDYTFDDICPSGDWKLYYPTVFASNTGPPTLVIGKNLNCPYINPN